MKTNIMIKMTRLTKQTYIVIFLLTLFLLRPSIGFAENDISDYGDFPYEQSFLTDINPPGVSKPTTTDGTNAAIFTNEGLQLTPKILKQFGAIFIDTLRFGSLNGIKIEFEYMIHGGTGADGFTVFFFDAAIESPQIGSYGAAIGYSYSRSLLRHELDARKPGLTGAYLGIAFDSFGNFKETRFQNEEIIGGVGRFTAAKSHVTLRGAKGVPYAPSGTPLSGMRDGYTGYPVLISQSTKATTDTTQYVILKDNGDYDFRAKSPYSDDFELRGGEKFDDGDIKNPAYRKAYINIFPIDAQKSGMYITVRIQHGEEISTVIYDYPYKSVTTYKETAIVSESQGDGIQGQLGEESVPFISAPISLASAIPEYIRIGFAAATGQGTDIHMIKNLRITLPGAAEAYDDFDTVQVNLPITINSFINDLAYQGVISENMIGSNSYINPVSFQFRLADGGTPDSNYSHQAAEGLWEFDPLTGLVTFTPAHGFKGDATIQYTIKGGLPGHTDPFDDEAYRSLPATISIHVAPCPAILVWTGNTDSDWDTESNWYPKTIPAYCTDVYIPGNVSTFPSLVQSGTNECRSIYFMPGAQLGQPQLLTYEKAYVQLNYGVGSLASQATITKEDLVAIGRDNVTSEMQTAFGAATSGVTLNRGRWNMLSAPLRDIVTGDFAFGGFPLSYIRKYDANGSASSYIMGKWADFSSETDFKFQPGQGFGHYYYPYKANTPYGMDNSENDTQWNAAKSYNGLIANTPKHIDGSSEYGLAQSNGILHFPYFSDTYLNNARRMIQYSGNETAGTSTFYFFYQSPLIYEYFLQFTGGKESITRANSAYRFITDGWNETYNAGTFAANEIVLVGNPYMSAFDFDAFYNANSSKIKRVFHIYQSPNTYVTYMGDGSANRFIAPMQSFLVETAAAGSLNLTFDAASMAKTNTATSLKAPRSASTSGLTIEASNQYGETSTYIRQLQNATNGFDSNDFSQIIDKPDNLPRVYSLVEMGNDQKRALLMNTIQNGNAVIPIGVVSTEKGDIKLTVSGMDTYESDIFFIDVVENTEELISGLPTFNYTFNHNPDKVAEVEGRFSLRFSQKSTTGLENENSEIDIIAYTLENDLVLISSGTNLIQSVMIYDLQGRCLLQKEISGTSFCKIENVFLATGAYIVKVFTQQGAKEIKIIR